MRPGRQEENDRGPVTIHQARWLLPITGPVLAGGAVAVRAGRILAVGPVAALRELSRREGSPVVVHDHGDGVILPGLVNTHIHLEFSALAGSIPPQATLPAWLAQAMAGMAASTPAAVDRGIQEAIAALRRFGTALVGEVSNSGRSLPWLLADGLPFRYFYECLGFDLLRDGPLETDFPFLADPRLTRLPVSAAAHAPYSVSGPLFGRIAAWNRSRQRPGSVHLAESPEEQRFLHHGDGPLRELLEQRGRWYEGYQPPDCPSAIYLDRLGFWQGPCLAVHGVHLSGEERCLLARRGVFLALCPRSNLHTGVGRPDAAALYRAGIKLSLGTDSLASAPDVNLFQEMKLLADSCPEIPWPDLLAMATLHGAEALGRGQEFGSLSPGKRAAILYLPLPADGDLWPGLLMAGVRGEIFWLTAGGKERWHGDESTTGTHPLY